MPSFWKKRRKTPLKGAKSAVLEEKFFRGAPQTGAVHRSVGDGVPDVPSARRCREALSFRASDRVTGVGIRVQKGRTDCRVAAHREASALGVLLAMTGCAGGGVSGSKKSKPRRGLLPLFRTACPAPLPVRRWHHPGSRAGDARRGCSAPAGWRWPGHSPPPPM